MESQYSSDDHKFELLCKVLKCTMLFKDFKIRGEGKDACIIEKQKSRKHAKKTG